MLFKPYKMNSFSDSAIDMPPADWCITTLQTLSNKYEHLSDSRKVNPPFAEAVLNSFKSKLINLVSSQSSFYDSESASDDEVEWTTLPSDCAYDSSTSNYLSIPSSVTTTSCYDTKPTDELESEDDFVTGIPSPSLSPTDVVGEDAYLGSSGCTTLTLLLLVATPLLLILSPCRQTLKKHFVASLPTTAVRFWVIRSPRLQVLLRQLWLTPLCLARIKAMSTKQRMAKMKILKMVLMHSLSLTLAAAPRALLTLRRAR
ncbi:hypothetical protein BX070DRAFT_105898 [Coemansia spiralis]|nr:hypothetical protein BX070DRAFT_105898 [Coemansia spiralis]